LETEAEEHVLAIAVKSKMRLILKEADVESWLVAVQREADL
jgi:hypothetical protein